VSRNQVPLITVLAVVIVAAPAGSSPNVKAVARSAPIEPTSAIVRNFPSSRSASPEVASAPDALDDGEVDHDERDEGADREQAGSG
jgi:hypothetical protein